MSAAEDRQQLIERGFHPAEVANLAPVDSVRIVAEVVVGQLLPPRQFGVDGGAAGEVVIEGSLLDVQRGLRG